MQTAIDRVQKLVTFSPQLYRNAQHKAKQLGVPFAEYLRYLVMKDIEEEIANLPIVDVQIDQRIGASLKALEEGKYTEVDPNNEKQLNELVALKKKI